MLFIFCAIYVLFFYPLILFTFHSQNDVNLRNSYKKEPLKAFSSLVALFCTYILK